MLLIEFFKLHHMDPDLSCDTYIVLCPPVSSRAVKSDKLVTSLVKHKTADWFEALVRKQKIFLDNMLNLCTDILVCQSPCEKIKHYFNPINSQIEDSYQIKSLQWQQNVGCLKNLGMNLWLLTSETFFFFRAPFLALAFVDNDIDSWKCFQN